MIWNICVLISVLNLNNNMMLKYSQTIMVKQLRGDESNNLTSNTVPKSN